MPIRLIQDVTFGAHGADAPHLGEGWSADEPGYRWTIGCSSELWLSNPGYLGLRDGELLLEIDASPFVCPPAIAAQRLAIYVDDVLVGSMLLREGGGRRAMRVPAGAPAGRRDVRLRFVHPDAARPSDHGHTDDARPLAVAFKRLSLFGVEAEGSGPMPSAGAPPCLEGQGGLAMEAVEARTSLSPAQLVTRFESLGDNCEFGLVQRRCGAEPLSLLRFSNIELAQLLRAVDSGFSGLGETDRLVLSLGEGPKREYVLRDGSFALTFHTFCYEGQTEPCKLLAQQSQRLKFLRRKLLEDFERGEKVFVVRRFDPLTEHEVLPLLAALSRRGPGRLLWTAEADASHPPGTVEHVMPGLLRGYLDRFAPDADAHDMSCAVWLEVCANALKLVRG